MSRRNSNNNYKTKRTWKTIGILLLAIIGVTFLTSSVGFMSGGFMESNPLEWMERDLNPDNLIKVDQYLIKDDHDDNKGIELSVDDNGVIKMNGKATSDNTFTIVEVDLLPGTYTISGLKSTDNYGLMVVGGTQINAKSGGSSATFTVETAQRVAVQLYVKEDTRVFYKTVRPVLVMDKDPGSFYE